MGIIDEIANMQKEGRSDQQIFSVLQSRGFSQEQISDALTQNKIKAAIAPEKDQPSEFTMVEKNAQITQEMEPSILTQENQQPSQLPPSEYPIPNTDESQSGYNYDQSQTPTYPAYQQYPSAEYGYPQYSAPSLSSDTINEIAEQVVTEKLSPIRKDIEKSIDLKNTLSTKLDYIDERLKRIEKIIDRLQLSILQKVGEYTTNIEDIKKELIETQKSFKSIASKKHH